MSNSPNLQLPFIQPAQAQKHVTHNEALERLDALVQLSVADLYATEAPAAPSEGQVLGVGAGGQGVFAGRDGQLACFTNGAWIFLTPREGMRAWNAASGTLHIRQGGTWPKFVPELGDLDAVGINAAADPFNRLSVAAPATLLSHEGAGHQVKINKAAPGDTASLLYQTGFSGRAEMGLAGDDDFALKVSADGAAWVTALSVEAASGDTTLGGVTAASLGGLAVQQAADDTTPGRLMRADYGYGPGTLLGPVAQAGGVPTGAVIERGANANGDYVRFADGTQICSVQKTLTYAAPSYLGVTWAFPAAFAAATTPAVTLLPNATTWAAQVGTGPAVGDVTVAQGNSSETLTVLQVWRRTGGANFGTGATAQMYATAFGRWF